MKKLYSLPSKNSQTDTPKAWHLEALSLLYCRVGSCPGRGSVPSHCISRGLGEMR